MSKPDVSSSAEKYSAIKFEISVLHFRFVIARLLSLIEIMKTADKRGKMYSFNVWSVGEKQQKLISSLKSYVDGGSRNFSDSSLLHLMTQASMVYMRKNDIFSHLMPRAKDEDQTARIQVKVSNMGFTADDYEFLTIHFPSEHIHESVLSMFNYIADTSIKQETPRSQSKTNISSPGSKYGISSAIQLPDDTSCCFEGFARTSSLSLEQRKSKPAIQLVYNDIDWRFCNYMRMLVDHPVRLIEKIKAIGVWIGIFSFYYKLNRDTDADYKIPDSVKKCINNRYIRFAKMANVEQSSADTLDKKIEAAAALFWLVNLSYQGNENGGCCTTNINKNFPKMIDELMLASIRLQGITILQMDIKDFIKKYKNRSDVLVILDPPYLGLNGENCVDYINNATDTKPFTRWDMKEMFRLCLRAKFKVLFFHSYNETVFKLCEEYSFRYQFSYAGMKSETKIDSATGKKIRRHFYSDIDDLSDNHNTIVCTLRVDTPIYAPNKKQVKLCKKLIDRLDGVVDINATNADTEKGGEA